MAKYNTFRKRCVVATECQEYDDAGFIINGTASTEIHVIRTDEDKQAAIVVDKCEEGPDKIIVYTYKEQESIKELLKADYFTHKNDLYFTYEDCKIIKDVKYIKQKAYECNVTFEVDCEEYGAYFISSLRKYVDDKIESKINVVNNNKPLLILPTQDWIKKDLVIIINDKPWMIVDYDKDTNSGISYISLEPSFKKVLDDKQYPIEHGLTPGIKQTVDTNFGYFSADIEVDVISKTLTKVVFVIPYGINKTEINISTKNENNEIITKQYKVVL